MIWVRRAHYSGFWSPTVIRLITRVTPSVFRAWSSALERASALATRPWSVTTASLVSTSMLNGLISPSAASLALTAAVIVASSTFCPTVLVELHAAATDNRTASASSNIGIRCSFQLGVIALPPPQSDRDRRGLRRGYAVCVQSS